MNPQEKINYEAHLKDLAISSSMLETAKFEGKLEGRLEGLREAILDSLAIRFAVVPGGITEGIRKIDSESRLRALHQASLRAESLDAFSREL
jgi:hypothetical protein